MKIKFPKFTFNSIKQSIPVWKKVFTSGWNLILFAALIIANITAYKACPVGGDATLFVSIILFFHRYIITYNGIIINDLMKKLEE